MDIGNKVPTPSLCLLALVPVLPARVSAALRMLSLMSTGVCAGCPVLVALPWRWHCLPVPLASRRDSELAWELGLSWDVV